MPRDISYRINAEGWQEFEKVLKGLGPAGQGALDQIKQKIPELADAFQKANKQVDDTRRKLEDLARTQQQTASARGAFTGAVDGLEQGAKRARRSLSDVQGTLQLLGPVAGEAAGGLGRLVSTAANVADSFGVLATLVKANPIGVLVTVAGTAAAAFLAFGGALDQAAKAQKALADAQKSYDEVAKTANERAAESVRLAKEKAIADAQAVVELRKRELAEAESAQKRQREIVQAQSNLNAFRQRNGAPPLPTQAPEVDARVTQARTNLDLAQNRLGVLANGPTGADRDAVASLAEQYAKLVAELDPAVAAQQKFDTQLAILNAAYEAGIVKSADYQEGLGRITNALEGANPALKARVKAEAEFWAENDKGVQAGADGLDRLREKEKARAGALQAYIDRQEEEARLSGQSNELREIGRAIIEAENRLRKESGDLARQLTDEERKRIEIAVKTRVENEAAQKAAEKYAQDVRRNTERVLDNVARAGADVLFDVLDKRNGSFWDNVYRLGKRTFANLAAEAATQAFLRPAVSSFVQSFPSLFGIAQPAGGGASPSSSGVSPLGLLQQGGSLFNMFSGNGIFSASSLSNAWSGVSNFFSGIFPSAAGTAGNLGAISAGTSTAIGAGGAGAFGLSGATGAYGALGGGFGGGLGGAGLGGGGAAAFGVGGSATAATPLTSFLGPAGIGFGIGALSRSLFGGSKTAGIIGGGIGGGIAGGALAGTAIFPGIGTLAGAAIGALAGILGGSLGGKKSVGPVGIANLGVSGGQFVLGPAAGDNGGDPSQVAQAVQQVAASLNQLKASFGLTLDPRLAGGAGALTIDNAAGFGIGSALTFGKYGGNFASSPEDLALRVLKGGVLSGTGQVGLALRNSDASTLEQLAKDLDIAKFIEGTADASKTLAGQLAEATKNLDEMGSRVEALGLDADKFNQQRAKALDAVSRDFAQSTGLTGLVDSLSFGGLSGSVTGEQRFFSALSRYNEVERRALTTRSATDIAEFSQVASGTFQIAEGFLGVSERTEALRNRILQSATTLGGQGADPAALARAQLQATTSGFADVVDAVTILTSKVADQESELRRLTAQNEALLRKVVNQ